MVNKYCNADTPFAPPSTLIIVVLSVTPSLLTDIDNGKSAFAKDENGSVNVRVPVPFVIVPLTVGVLIVPLLPNLVIVISVPAIAPLRFCWFIEKTADVGVAEVSVESSNANVWVSDVNVIVLAFSPGVPSEPCCAAETVIVLLNTVEPDVAVITTEPLYGVVAFVMVTVSPLVVVVIWDETEPVFIV